MLRKRDKVWPWLLIVVAASAACQPAGAPLTTPTPANLAPARSTPTSVRPVHPTATAVPPPSPTASPTPYSFGPLDDFSEASVYAIAHLGTGQLQVTIRMPGGVNGVYNARVNGTRLPCQPISGYPDRLYCIGAEPATNYSPDGAVIELYPLIGKINEQPPFQATFTLPARATPTQTPLPWYPPLPNLPFP